MKHPPRLYFTSSEELSPHEHPDFRGIPYVEYLSLTEAKELAAKAREEGRAEVIAEQKEKSTKRKLKRFLELKDRLEGIGCTYSSSPTQPSRRGEKDE